eukprot:jgi/Chlat1/6926/Chrsp52S06638
MTSHSSTVSVSGSFGPKRSSAHITACRHNDNDDDHHHDYNNLADHDGNNNTTTYAGGGKAIRPEIRLNLFETLAVLPAECLRSPYEARSKAKGAAASARHAHTLTHAFAGIPEVGGRPVLSHRMPPLRMTN